MVSKTTTVVAAQGFHMRPASQFVSKMNKFECQIKIIFGDKVVDAKSLMNILAASIKKGSQVTVQADGVDENQALQLAIELIDSGFGE